MNVNRAPDRRGAAARAEHAASAPAPSNGGEPKLSLPAPTYVRSLALTILAVIALVLMLRYAQAVIIPIVLGVLISYALDPVVAKLVRLRVPRPIGAALVLMMMAGAGGVLAYQLSGQVVTIVDQLPEAARRVRRMVERDGRGGTSPMAQVQEAANELEKAASAATPPPSRPGVTRVQVEDPPLRISSYVMWGSMGAAAALAQLVLILFLSYFLLASGNLYRRKLVKIVGATLTEKKVTVQILEEIDRQIAYFLLVQLCTSIFVGVASWLAFRWLGLQQAALWGLLAGVFNSIPYFGPVTVTGTIAFVAFMQFGTLQMTLTAAAVAFAITTLEGMLLTPYLTSRAARMNAVAVFVGLLFWGWVWEVWGLLLAVPMLMMIKAVCDHVEDFKNVGELLGE
jgi:predicted PurR-regulated permease PerM